MSPQDDACAPLPQPATLAAAMARHAVAVRAEFVPWSRSRHAGDKTPSLNWRVTISVAGRDVLTTDYGAGMAHCPAYSDPGYGRPGAMTTDRVAAIRRECEMGRAFGRGGAILPEPSDVMYSLLSEAEAIDHPSFESWADDFGADPDSRKAEATYRACLDIGLRLRAGLGAAALADLRAAAQDY